MVHEGRLTDITQLILDTSDKDPQGYVRAVQDQFSPGGESASLGIGSLKGR